MAKVKSPKTAIPQFTLTIKLGSAVMEAKGETILQALSAIPKPDKITTKLFLTVTDGVKKKERMFPPVEAKRLFYPMVQPFISRQLLQTMK